MNTHDNNGFSTPENQTQGENQPTVNAWNEAQHTGTELPSFGTETQQSIDQEQNPFQVSPEQPSWNETPNNSIQTGTTGDVWTAPVSDAPVTEQTKTDAPWETTVNEASFSEKHTSSFEQVKAQTFGEPQQTLQNENTETQNVWGTPQVEQQTFVGQTGMHQYTPPMMPNKKSNKKLITLIVSGVMALILIILAVTYGMGVNNKMQAVEAMKKERSSLQTEKDEADKAADKAETLEALVVAKYCYEDIGGLAFDLTGDSYQGDGKIDIGMLSPEKFKSKLQACRPKEENVKLDGVKERVEQVEKSMQEAFDGNTQHAKDAQAVADAWKAFYDAAPKGGTGTTHLDPATFDRLKGLAATAMGVDPASIGTTISYADVARKVISRIRELELKQSRVSATQIRNFLKEQGAETKTSSKLKSEKDEQRERSEKKSAEIDEKSSAIKTKESEIWNPFK